MEMFIIIIVAFILIGEAIFSGAWQYCSDSKDAVRCVGCKNPDGSNQFKCPNQCGTSRNINLCDKVCNDHCVNSACAYNTDGTTLQCLEGCTDTYTGPNCQEYCMSGCVRCDQDKCLMCQPGLYGEQCQKECKNCKNGKCFTDAGTCTAGCKPGFYGKKCDIRCENCIKFGSDKENCDHTSGTCLFGCRFGTYGTRCEKDCLPNCAQCHNETGLCLRCASGWCDKNCSEREEGGARCDKKCHSRCTPCDVQTGECQQCIAGWFGINCTQKCQHCKNASCRFESGGCTEGCEEGFILQGKTCQTEDDKDKDKGYLWTAIVCISILCVGNTVVFAVCLYKRRLPGCQPSNVSGGSVYGHYCEIDDNDVDSSSCVNHEVQIEQPGHTSSRNFPSWDMASPIPCTSATADPQTRRTHAESILENHVYESVGSGGACAARMSTSSLAADEYQLRPRDDVRLLQGGNPYATRSLGSVTSEDLRLTRKTESMLLWEQNILDFSKVYVKYSTPKSQDKSQ